jgi:hypothetical protein
MGVVLNVSSTRKPRFGHLRIQVLQYQLFHVGKALSHLQTPRITNSRTTQTFSLTTLISQMLPSMIPQPQSPTRAPSRTDKSQKHRCSTLRSTVGPVVTHLCAFAFSWNLGCIYHCVSRCNIHAGSQVLEDRLQKGPSFDCPRIHRRREAPTSPNDSVPQTLTKLLVSTTTVSYTEFVSSFALGAPLQGVSNPDDTKARVGGSRVLLLQQTPSSHSTTDSSGTATAPLRAAMKNCREVKHIVVHLGKRNERSRGTCVALVGQRESYHLNKWIQGIDTAAGEHTLSHTNNYQFLPEYGGMSGLLSYIPHSSHVPAFFEVARGLMEAADDAMVDLQPLSDKVAAAGHESVKGTMVVMVSNFGHAELLVNFVCSARANGVDLGKVLMFATDAEVHQIALSLGLASFFNEGIFRSIPQRAAYIYGDETYARIMLSKSFVTLLASRTGHDFIFQDVDIIPYHPEYWSWWTAKKDGDYDLYFQQDFNVRPEYAPWYVTTVQCRSAIDRVHSNHVVQPNSFVRSSRSGSPTLVATLRRTTHEPGTCFRASFGEVT